MAQHTGADAQTLRDKDRELSDRCSAAAEAAGDAIEWLDANREPSAQITNLKKQMRRQAVEARRLGTASVRPVSVGVFGASQMGKSFLIGKLIQPEGQPIHVVFGQGEDVVRRDFLSDVNPSGGDETTGLVTRFSLKSFGTPAGNPVVLKMLREVDVAKIFANSFLYDLKGSYRITTDVDAETIEDRTPGIDSFNQLAEKLETIARPDAQPGMSIEDVYELREYVQKNLDDHLLSQESAESYWNILEQIAPRLDTAGRVMALSPLWAGLEEFNDLYAQLKNGLDELGHPRIVYTGLNALADRSRGVLHVNTLMDLDDKGATETMAVVSDAGTNVTLPMCVVTALTSELCVTLEEGPWPFFLHTDLLDFPGARSRKGKKVHEYLRDESEPLARANCFLRGKVAVLFDNYAADLDLNVMLLCAGFENAEVTTLPGLVKEWIIRTHGDTPAKRQNAPTGLFYCLTKCDTLFVRKVGLDDPITTRLENNVKPYPWWIDEWTPGQPFENTFLIRNPAIEDRGLFKYDDKPDVAPEDYVPPELGLTPEFALYLEDTFRAKFNENALVRKYVADPERKLAALLELNDGGTSLLAESLAPVCNPDLKYDQILPRVDTMQSVLRNELSRFYETGDLEKRVRKRKERIGRLIAELRKRPNQIGPFIASFQIDSALMETAYRQYRRSHMETPPEADVFSAVFGDSDTREEDTVQHGFGRVLIEWWARNLGSRVADSPWLERFSLDEETLQGLVEEIVISSERLKMDKVLERQVDGFTTSSMRLDDAARRVSIFASMTLNDLMNFPHGRMPDDAPDRFRPNTAGPDSLPEDTNALNAVRLQYFKDWMDAIQEVTVANASWGSGGSVDVEANARMGEILGKLGWTG